MPFAAMLLVLAERQASTPPHRKLDLTTGKTAGQGPARRSGHIRRSFTVAVSIDLLEARCRHHPRFTPSVTAAV